MNPLNVGRIKYLGIAICIFALIIVARLCYVQIIKNQYFLNQADKQYIRTNQSLFDRGTIFFTTRDNTLVSAATLKSGYTVAVDPKQIEHPEDAFNLLTGTLPIDDKTLLQKLSGTGVYEELAHRVDEAKKNQIAKLNITGVGEYPERWRYYPDGPSAANVLGLLGYAQDGTTFTGRYGLEKYYNDVLSRDSSNVSVNFFAQIFSDLSDSFLKNEMSQGDIVTTIEPSVERELDNQLANVMTEWKSDLTGGIIMDPYTGEIYAMSVNPSFDPNNFSGVKDPTIFGNPLIDRVYEMGSIIKPLAMSAGLDTGVVTPETKYDDTGYVMIDGAKVSNYDGRARGIIDMQTVLSDSLNVGMAFVTKQLGIDNLTKYFKSYGFGDETGIDLPGEVHGLISNLDSPRELEHATAAFGQGIALTPIETIRALSALGNGGFLPDPHIVKRIDYVSGTSKTISYDYKKQVFKPETSDTITRMLVKVVDDALLGGTVKFAHYTVAAKTGTAQIPDGGGYYNDRYLHSFFGYFPAYKPRFIIFLYTVYPKGAEYASHTLTMPFIDLAKFLINYYNIAPDR